MFDLEIFKKVKVLQSGTTTRVFHVVYKNYKGLTIEAEPIELAVTKSLLGISSSSKHDFLTRARGKYGY